ncbi:MAG: hypothetical protein M1834_009555 [Cirrosporium novae-zelandiae]|nr:MAG: hypothetical protein M1834_009555 [Cirrosporium novae-zelandiae]
MRWIDAAAVVDEWRFGPRPDVVSTQGLHLVPHPDTPVIDWVPGPDFEEKLQKKLDLLLFVQDIRCYKYGEQDAEEWPIGHTPPELQQRYDDRQARAMDLLEAPTPLTPEDSSNDNLIALAKPSHLMPDNSPQLTAYDIHDLVLKQRSQVPYTPPSSSEGQPSQRHLPYLRQNSENSPHVRNLDKNDQSESLGDRQNISLLGVTSSPNRNGKLLGVTKQPKKRRYSKVDGETERVDFMGHPTGAVMDLKPVLYNDSPIRKIKKTKTLITDPTD